MKNRARRRLGFVFMVLAVISAAYNLEQSTYPAMIGMPVVFLIAGAALLRKTRSTHE